MTARSVVASPWFRPTARVVVGGGVLVAILARLGTGPFLHGLASLDAATAGAAMVLTLIATAATAWRWHLIAGRLGVGVRWSTAVGLYYRSQFLNLVLPGGVIGDAERALEHGRRAGRPGPAARAVVVERVAGQLVLVALAAVVLAFFGAGFHAVLLPSAGAALALAAAAALAVTASAVASMRVRRALRHEADALRDALGSPTVSAQVVAASVVAVCCHLALFGIAAGAVGAGVPPARLPALAVVVLLAASIPLNVGGWGPREGIAAWAFAVAGFGAAAGVAAATLFGVLALLSVAPGVIVTALASLVSRRNHRDRQPVRDPQLRHLPRRLPRHRPSSAGRALEPGGLRSGG
jgi:uncharacterized membrane protein YbhN (UPF0104 family)